MSNKRKEFGLKRLVMLVVLLIVLGPFASCATTVNAFYDLTEYDKYGFYIKEGVLYDYAYGFAEHPTQDIVIPNGVKVIGEGAFARNPSITKVTIPDSVTTIQKGAFRDNTNLKSVVGAKNVQSIGEEAFSRCSSLTAFPFTNQLKTIGKSAFSLCKSLTELKLPNSVTSIGDAAFFFCEKVKTVSISNQLTELPNSVFGNCSSLQQVIIPNSVTVIGEGAFNSCTGLTAVTLPNKLKEIKSLAFEACTKLTKLNIPSTVRKLGTIPFADVKFITAGKDSVAHKYAKENNIDVMYKNVTGLHKSKYTLLVKESYQLYMNTNASGTIKWSSSNSKVVTVSKKGKLTAKKAGTVTITATLNKKKYRCKITVLSRTVENRIKQVESNYALQNATDYEKIYAVNMWLIYNVKYDHSLKARTVKEALLQGKAVCQGYALAFTEFMDYFKIPNKYIVSYSMDHAWNLVQINTKWYHVDTTNNHPGRPFNYFLETDAEMERYNYYGYYTYEACKSTKIDKSYKSPQLKKTQVTIKRGKSTTLAFNKKVKSVEWISSNSKIATVSKKGVVKAKKKGTVKIQAYIAGRMMGYEVTVKVK